VKSITIGLFLCALFLVQPFQIQKTGMWYPDDDHDYMAHATSIVFGQFPSYENEYYGGKNRPKGSIGTGLMASPFVFLGSLVDRLLGSDIGFKRTRENVVHSWSQFGFIVATSVYFWIGCFLLYRGLRYYCSSNYASWAVILMVLCQGVPLFIYRRPIFTHGYEFFLQSIMVFILLKVHADPHFDIQRKRVLCTIGVVLALMFLVRLNNICAAMMWPVVLMANRNIKLGTKEFFKSAGIIFLFFSIIVVSFKIFPGFLNPSSGYQGVIQDKLLTILPATFYFKRFAHILFGLDWGLFYTAPFILIGLSAFVFLKFPLKKELAISLIPMAVNFYIIMTWKTQGSWYGYRYFVVSIIPLLVLPMAFVLKWVHKRCTWGRILWGTLAVLPVISMLLFEGYTLTLQKIEQYFGVIGWGNNIYQIHVWETFLFSPGEFFYIAYNRGLRYIVYLVYVGMDFFHVRPLNYFRSYPEFHFYTAIRTVILLLLPFLLYGINLLVSAKRRLKQDFRKNING